MDYREKSNNGEELTVLEEIIAGKETYEDGESTISIEDSKEVAKQYAKYYLTKEVNMEQKSYILGLLNITNLLKEIEND